MPTPKDITVIDVNGKTYAVDSCSKAIQELVEFYNIYNRRAYDLNIDLQMALAAREHMAAQMRAQLQIEEREQLEKVQTPPDTEPTLGQKVETMINSPEANANEQQAS